MIHPHQRLLWAAALATAAFAASAQTPPPSEPGTAPQRMERGDPAKRMERREHMQKRHAEHLAQLKDKLKLNASQESAWATFAAAHQPPAPPAQRMDRASLEKMTTPQRLDLMQQRMSEHSAAFTRRTDATRAFYATLSPAQQKTFDAETLRFGRHGGDHFGMHEDHHGMPKAKGK